MRRLLYVTFENIQVYSGGSQCANRNLQSLKDILGENQIIVYTIKPNSMRNIVGHLQRFIGICKGYFGGLNEYHRKSIQNLIINEAVTDIFIDNSQLGLIAKDAKRINQSIRIYAFFHNIEYDFIKSNVIDNRNYSHFFWIPLAKYNERTACRYSNCIIALNNSDASRLKLLYGRKADTVIPISMKDDTTIENDNLETSHTQKKALFVGSYFFGNTKGLSWFCKEVLPYTDIHLTIVGSGMESFKKDIDSFNRISIFSNVPDLAPFYRDADFVVLPITTGGGMKVKTAEALKYGKYIIGTKEALNGYDIDSNIATECKNAEDFITAIRLLNRQLKYNAYSRELFLDKYSYNTTLKLFSDII